MPEKKFVTVDGNTAAAHAAYAFTEVAAIYPITPSSNMAEKTDVWAAKGRLNMFGQPVSLVEMQSEAGAIAAVHGALQTGALSTSFTSSQGLLLMIPVLHRIAGELLPCVLHVASRTVGTHAMSIFGDHSDVMNCRQTGFAMLSTGSVQEVMDLAGLAHLAALRSRVPFLHFFDGFRTSHELTKVEEMDVDALSGLLDKDALAAFRARALNPEHPRLRGTVQNGDVYFQAREAASRFYDAVPAIVEGYMRDIARITGREYHLFDYFGVPDAEEVIIAMGSVSGVARDAVDFLNAQGRKVGFVQVHLFRPFSSRHLLDAIPATAKRIAVLDRCREMGSAGEPLYQDVCTAFTHSERSPLIIGGVYGLSSKDVDPGQMRDVFDELLRPSPKERFTIGIEDDVTFRSLPSGGPLDIDGGMVSCKFWGLGSDGTVGANKNTVDIINQATPLYAQAYFEFDAKKSFGITKSHLRFSDQPIRSSYFVRRADVVACHNQTYVDRYAMADELKEGGSFLLSCSWKAEELSERLPASLKRTLAQKKARLWIIDAPALAQKIGLGRHTNIILQAAFFRLAGALPGFVPLEKAEKLMEEAVRKTYFAKGDEVVARNIAAIRAGIDNLTEVAVPESWLSDEGAPAFQREDMPSVVKNLLEPINAQQGDTLPVSAFLGYEDGRMDMGLTAWEKRDIAVSVPRWEAEKCIQCNRCSFVCPHAVLRPYLLTQEEADAAPQGFVSVYARGKAAEGLAYSLQVGVLDCTGCGSCVEACPAKALSMIPRADSSDTLENWEYGLSLSDKPNIFDI
ncbi:MAG: pyruvate:ferredoxin (flavodoxin) oxidoreductase, partial [Mailhella sp.]|nr:pyruvate:ferredoxin (flavodoxin) oxidoreductase [Mailhella sp.]